VIESAGRKGRAKRWIWRSIFRVAYPPGMPGLSAIRRGILRPGESKSSRDGRLGDEPGEQFSAAVDGELFVERFDVDVNGVLAEGELAGDLFFGVAGELAAQRLALPRGEIRHIDPGEFRSRVRGMMIRRLHCGVGAISDELAEVREQLAALLRRLIFDACDASMDGCLPLAPHSSK
jgi:hypothetical protein